MIDENGTVTLSGTYHDVGTQDTHTLTIDWGEGRRRLTLPVPGGTFSFTHQYLDDNPDGHGQRRVHDRRHADGRRHGDGTDSTTTTITTWRR